MMAVDRWFIGGGAEHTPESARRLVYASTGGAEGVGGATDLQVAPLAVPGGGVRVTVGSALIRSLYVGGDTQTYMGTVYEQETVAIASTGSGSGRSDLIVLRVEDPFAAGSPWDPPGEEDIALAPYVHVRVISGVPSGTKRLQDVPGHETDTAVTLARVDLPVSTGTVTAGEIVDLREVARPRALRQRDLVSPTVNSLAGAAEVVWPAATTQQVRIPEWATEITVMANIMGLLVTVNWVAVEFRLRLGTASYVYSPVSGLTTDTGSGATERVDKVIPMRIPIPEAMRGTTQPLVILAKKTGGAGTISTSARTVVEFDTEVTEKP